MNITDQALRTAIIALAGKITLGLVELPAVGSLTGTLNVAQTYQEEAARRVASRAACKGVDAGNLREWTDAVELERLAGKVVSMLKANW